MSEIPLGTVCGAQTELCTRPVCKLAPYCEAIAQKEAELYLARSESGTELTDNTMQAIIDLSSMVSEIAKAENLNPTLLLLMITRKALRAKGHNTDNLF